MAVRPAVEAAPNLSHDKESKKSMLSKIFSMSCVASVFTVLYLLLAALNLYRLMYPLALLDLSIVEESSFVGPLWNEQVPLHMKVFLSVQPKFNMDVLKSEYPQENQELSSLLLWEKEINSPEVSSSSKSFLLTTLDDCLVVDEESLDSMTCQNRDDSYASAAQWLDEADRIASGGILSGLSAGEGIESTSVLLTLYNVVVEQLKGAIAYLSSSSKSSREEEDSKGSSDNDATSEPRSIVSLSSTSPLWKKLHSNSTLYIHVLVTKHEHGQAPSKPSTLEEATQTLRTQSQSHSLLMGAVDLVKYDLPHHITAPGRILYRDLVYLWRRYVLRTLDESTLPPWNMADAKPADFAAHQQALEMKQTKTGYPYWKPEVAVKYVHDNVKYPDEYVHLSGMDLVRLSSKTRSHPTGIVHLPALYVDEIGLTSEKYIPVNATLTSLPLRISFDRSDMEPPPLSSHQQRATATAGGISSARWRLLSHFSQAIESQKELGFEQSDIDDLRRLIADTNVTLLAITLLASGLHLLFEFLTFKNEVSFWRNNTDLTGLSVRSLFLDMIGQVVILLFLIQKDSSLLMTVPSGIGCLIALWKCQRGAGFQFVRIDKKQGGTSTSWWNVLPRLVGYELRATRLDVARNLHNVEKRQESSGGVDLKALTIETDRTATRTLGTLLLPAVLAYTLYSLLQEEHTGWYSWLITSASSAVYALGFALMTPQLFLNYKLKSVAHLPWRVLVYRFLNTFIDDLFAFIIRMPTMARISCFRDDIVFFIYLYQRWLYPVDTSRPIEGGDGSATSSNTTTNADKKNQ